MTELLVGVRTEAERIKLMRQLGVFGRTAVEGPVWEIAGRVGAAMEAQGTRIPFPDMLIVGTAIHHGLPLWTRDKHFARIQDVAPELLLFDETTS